MTPEQVAQRRRQINVYEESRLLLQGLEGNLKEGDILFHLPKDAQSFNLTEELVIFNNTQDVRTLSREGMGAIGAISNNIIYSNYALMEESGQRYLKLYGKSVIEPNDRRYPEYNQRLKEAKR